MASNSANETANEPANEESNSHSFDDQEKTNLKDHVYKIALGSALALIALATVFYHFMENWSWVDAFYFSSVAITTVGFGDLSPSTDASKLFTVFYIFAGISLIGLVLSQSLEHRARRAVHRRGRD